MRAVIDRFEGNKAILLLGENEDVQVAWPRQFLPCEVQEGDILQFDFRIDTVATSFAKVEAEALLQQILDQNKKE